jgi:membrane protease YdiL (CAAX protease family)
MNEDLPQPPHFALMAAVFEGSLAVVAIVLGRGLGYPPLDTLVINWPGLARGILGTLPPLVLLLLCLWVPARPFSQVLKAVDELLIPLFRGVHVVEMAVIAILAGLGEEMLFRGVLQAAIIPPIGRMLGPGIGTWLGLPVADWIAAGLIAVVFGLMHFINRSYALLAGLIGLYLGWLWMVTGNLMVPITAHALYDFLALVYLVKVRRKKQDGFPKPSPLDWTD